MIRLLDILQINIQELTNFYINESWKEFLEDETVSKELSKILLTLEGTNFTPESLDKALIFLTKNINEIRIILKGINPYPSQPILNKETNKLMYAATGRAFEVGTLNSWLEPFDQNSLQNIVRLLYKNYNNIENYNDIPKFTEIREKIANGKFNILPPNEIFKHWDNQGVLLINTYATCDLSAKKVSNSHKQLWQNFSNKLFKYIPNKNPNIIWFLWGTEAMKTKSFIKDNVVIYESRHPMLCSPKYDNDFLKSNCFKDTMDIINWIN